jgi:hypothetical protein
MTGLAPKNGGRIENADKANPDFIKFLRAELLIIKNNKTMFCSNHELTST